MTILCALTCLTVAACERPTEPRNLQATTASLTKHGGGEKVSATGVGLIDLSAVAGAEDAVFFVNAKLNKDGTAKGHFRQRRVRNGLVVDFSGEVTCLTVDESLGRARIGGVITENNSTDPAFLTENHQVGDDVWFRVQEGDRETGIVDASTTYGFKPTLVNTSAEYCALPFTGLPEWNPATTFPLRAGHIKVRP